MTPEEDIKRENAALYKIVERFARLRADEAHPRLEESVKLAREELSALKGPKKQQRIRELDDLEQATQNVLSVLACIPIEAPVLIVTRFGRNMWDAHIEDHEEALGVGEGISPAKAAQQLREKIVG